MAIAFSASGNTITAASGTTVVSPSIAVGVGDLVVVCGGDAVGGTAPSISDSLGQSWTALTGPTTNGRRLAKWYSVITVGGSMTVTLTYDSSTVRRAVIVAAFTGLGASPLDANPANVSDNTSPYDCPSTGTLAQLDELVIGFAVVQAGGSLSATSPDTLLENPRAAGLTVAMSYRIVSGTSAVSPQFTGPSDSGVVGTASFKGGSAVLIPRRVDPVYLRM